MRTPWGKADHVTDIGRGIKCVSTPGHGGYFVPAETRKQMPPAALQTWAGPGWYEEDCDWALVALSFPELFPAEAIEHAKTTVSNWMSAEKCAAFGLPHTPRR